MILKSKKFYGSFIEQPIFAKELFAGLPLTTRKKISSIQQRGEIKEGEIICETGSFPRNIYVLREGKAQLILQNGLNRKKNVRLIKKEEIMGLTQSISGSPSLMSVVALSVCSVDVFAAQNFLNLLQNEPQICFRLLRRLSSDIQADYAVFSAMYF